MTWPSFRFHQRDLQGLSKVWPVHECEYHTENMLFGFDQILRSYAALPADEPLPWAMEHTISFNNPEPHGRDVRSRLPVFLSVTQGQADILGRHNPARILPIGSSYYYMRSLFDRFYRDAPGGERRGTLVFPDKSVVHKDVDFDRNRFADELAALPDEFQPVAVSIFWKDYLRGTHRPFENAGLMLVTSGYSYDPAFLFRQYDLCRQFKYAAANDLSTSFCLSVLAGCRFIYRPTGVLKVRDGKTIQTYDQEPTLHLPAKQECIAASPYPPDAGNSLQRQLADRYAGASCVRPPDFFVSLFEEGRRLLQSRPVRTICFGPQTRLDDVAGWLPRGIDPGGWSQDWFGIAIPDQVDAPAVRLHLQIPRRALKERVETATVEIAGMVSQAFRVKSGFWTLDIPLDAARGKAVTIRWPLRHDGPPAFRGMRLFQIGRCGDKPAVPHWRRHTFLSWRRGVGNRSGLSLIRKIVTSRGGDFLRAFRGQSLPGNRALPGSKSF